MSAPTFLGMAHDLMLDTDAKEAFERDPDGFLAARGFEGLSPEDLADAVGFVAETLPPETAQALIDPGTEGDLLARLAQLEPAASDEPAGGTDPTFDPDLGAPDPEDRGDDEEDGDEDDDLDLAGGADPTQIPDDPGLTGFEAFREDVGEAGLGVGYGNEDVDDVSPPGHGDVPDLDF